MAIVPRLTCAGSVARQLIVFAGYSGPLRLGDDPPKQPMFRFLYLRGQDLFLWPSRGRHQEQRHDNAGC